jgi:phosphonoacetate hydrolase
MRREGFHRPALAAMPAFANPNNVSIVCGVPPKIHGVSGNFHFDQESGEDVMMVDATPMRAPTILSAFSAAGARAAAITAKDKLPKALGKDPSASPSALRRRPRQRRRKAASAMSSCRRIAKAISL